MAQNNRMSSESNDQIYLSIAESRKRKTQVNYYPEDVLIAKVQSGEYTWLDYVNHFSSEWQDEYEAYCETNGLAIDQTSAEMFVHHKDKQLEEGMESGEA